MCNKSAKTWKTCVLSAKKEIKHRKHMLCAKNYTANVCFMCNRGEETLHMYVSCPTEKLKLKLCIFCKIGKNPQEKCFMCKKSTENVCSMCKTNKENNKRQKMSQAQKRRKRREQTRDLCAKTKKRRKKCKRVCYVLKCEGSGFRPRRRHTCQEDNRPLMGHRNLAECILGGGGAVASEGGDAAGGDAAGGGAAGGGAAGGGAAGGGAAGGGVLRSSRIQLVTGNQRQEKNSRRSTAGNEEAESFTSTRRQSSLESWSSPAAAYMRGVSSGVELQQVPDWEASL